MKEVFYILFAFNISLLTINAQKQLDALPKYNICIPVHSDKDIYHNPPFITNSGLFKWQYYQFPFSHGFTDIFFIDLSYGWATHGGFGVARTTNSGINWDTTSFGPSNYLGGVHFINRNTGWVVGDEGTIRKTTNGGVNWIIQDHEIYAGYYRKVHFFDENTGVVIGEKNGPYAYIIKTTNSGSNWNEIFISPTYYTELRNQYWFNSNTGWICGSNILLKTTNGGVNFSNHFLGIPPTQNNDNGLLGISFANDYTGWIAAANADNKNIYKSTNGGQNWFFQDNPVAQYEFSQINDIEFISIDSGWAGSFIGILLFTSNGGNNWIIGYTAPTEFWSLTSYSNIKIWSGAAYGQIWYATIHEPNGSLGQGEKLPAQLNLLQNYPNPFNSKTTIKFDLPKEGFVTFKVYDVLGKEIYSVREYRTAGTHQLTIDGSNYASGLYFYRIETGSFVETKKMVLIK